MPSGKVRADYDQLQEISKMFDRESDACNGKNQRVKSNIETLRGGDWQGVGARAFFKEMDSEVLPALGRLRHALAEAAKITAQVAKAMKQAEDDSSALFKL